MKPLDLKNVIFSKEGKYIDVQLKLKAPEKLYKFYALNDYSVKSIENGTIFFSPNNLLNDVLEGNFELLWDFESFKNKKKVFENKITVNNMVKKANTNRTIIICTPLLFIG